MHENKFQPRHRLSEKEEFARFFQEGTEVLFLDHATVFRVPNTQPHFRLGMTLKLKASSVERNRLKRIVREAFREHPIRKERYDWNVVVKGSLRGIPFTEYAEFREELLQGLSAGRFRPVRKSAR